MTSKLPGLTLVFFALTAQAQDAPIVQPGAPGEPSRQLSAEEAISIAGTSYSPDDVRFMADMIPHHHQALEMAALVADRTNRPELVDVAGRINASQQDEIEFMQTWLRERGENVPDPTAHHAMHTEHRMAGMASPQQMADLAAASGTGFDRLFLQLMITHHEGAVTMVDELREQPGSAFDPVLFEFTNDIVNDQSVEIERMNALLVTLSDDPRAGLSAGFDDAGEAILNLKLVAALPRPAGFFDPANPSALAPELPDEEQEEEDEETPTAPQERSPLLSFANTDMAFFDDVLVAGSYHGFNIYRLARDSAPALLSSIVCPGGQGDVSVVGDLLIMSVQETRSRLDCGLEGITEDVSPERFRGIRIFDISDLSQPRQVGVVQTCRGSHTHSVVDVNDRRIIVYNSGTSTIRDEEELEGCYDSPGDVRTALFRIDVIRIPIDDPASAHITSSPAVFADPEDEGVLAGLWRGGEHDDESQETSMTDQCHDITVFPDLALAAGACSGNGILFDISDPLNPKRLDAVVDRGFAYWHSATFSNDGTKVLFTDEWGGGSRPRCRTYDPLDWGADAIYDIVDNKLEFRSYFKMPAPQVEQENCVAHNGSIIPVPGRDLFVQAWYQGGISVIDFTDSANPVEIAYFDRGPIDAEQLVLGGYWSSYWYGDRIYATEIYRGLDVFELLPSEHLSANEIAAATLAMQGEVFNPQTQHRLTWPDTPAVAMAYVDQLVRSGDMNDRLAEEIDAALSGGDARTLQRLIAMMESDNGNGITLQRKAALADVLGGIAATY
jgi:uncharacterized protein (DUF305 family)